MKSAIIYPTLDKKQEIQISMTKQEENIAGEEKPTADHSEIDLNDWA